MSNTLQPTQSLLIASVTPQNLERGVLWFAENEGAIRKARLTNPWWRDNALFIEIGDAVKPSELLRKFLDLGYERAQAVVGRGVVAVRGGIIEIWPINAEKPWLIEYEGNVIVSLKERPSGEEKAKPRVPTLNQTIEQLAEGSYVVHIDHGIGIFRGVIQKNSAYDNAPPSSFENWKLEIGNSTKKFSEKFFVAEYAPPAKGGEPDRLYVPVGQKDRLTPYVGFETPAIHRLGGTIWFRTMRRAREDAEKLAKELLALYAKRHSATRPPCMGDAALEQELRASFLYTETDSQQRAEGEILIDLERPIPMDRVLCGDVGFGKTELAIRATLRAIASGGQVAILAPTTILAAQHQKTFTERLQQFPIRIGMLSRLTPPGEDKKIIRGLRAGETDCVIGTHRILSSNIGFKNLRLVIVDEEQRFGVKHKEHFKNMRGDIDILSLSATPIPRTLHLSLSKIRDISYLETPPPDRMPVKTFVLPFRARAVRDAVEREMARRGQVYVLHNRVETIGHFRMRLEHMLRPLRPRIAILHGRMREKDIMDIMDKFRAHQVDILLATTIIENGLDISNANTLIVEDATRLGLAQAHQLRGRIGRGNVEAYAYFLYRPRNLTDDAAERLETLQEYAHLGAGYQIAVRDLETRGAGNILGREQSGAINKVGLNLYYTMLSEAIEEMKSGLP